MSGLGATSEADNAEMLDTSLDPETDDYGTDDENYVASEDNMGDNDTEDVFDERKTSIALARLICFKKMPPQSVEDGAFKRLMYSLNPQFQVCFDTLQSDCLDIYEKKRARIKGILTNMDGQISLSAEVLRQYKDFHRCEYDEYLCLKAHFIDDDWKLKNWVLAFSPVWDLSEDLPDEMILKSLKDWDIGNKISALTMVESSYNNELSDLVKSYIQSKKELQLSGRLFRVTCCGDVINLMVQDAFNEMGGIMDKVSELYPLHKCPPVWYLTNCNLQRALQLEAMGEFSSDDVIKNYEVPSVDEWSKVRSICRLIDRIYKVAKVLFETKPLTANIYLYHLQELQAFLTRESTSSDSFIRTVAMKMLERYNKYMKDMVLILTIATVMDPRYKIKYIEFASSKFEFGDLIGNSQVTSALEAIRCLFDDYVARFPVKKNPACKISCSDSEEDFPRDAKEQSQNPIDDFTVLREYNQFVQSATQPQKSELDWYLEEPILPWSQDFCVLSWWKGASVQFPILSRMARDFLAIPISIAASSQAFYTEPREVDPKVICSRPALMSTLMCTRSWYERL